MSRRLFRRDFFKQSLAFLSGLFFLQGSSQNLRAEDKRDCSIDNHVSLINDTIKTIRNLRTIHGNFTKQEIPDSKLQLILQSTVRAANSSNMQTYSIIVVKDRAKMEKISGYQASCMLLYCVDYTRLKASAKSLGHSYYPDNIVSFVTGSINTILAAQTAAIAAKSLGIDYLFTNGIHRGDMERVWNILDLPQEHCFPLIALFLGYPTNEPAYKMGRLERTGIIHYDKYQPLTKDKLDEITTQYDDRTLHISLIDNWEEKGYKHYLDWLFADWMKRRSKPTDCETQMFDLLKRSDFVDLQKS